MVTDQATREWLCEPSDVNSGKIKDIFLMHSFQWAERDPYKKEYSLWKLEDERFSSSANIILYERRDVIWEGY